MLPFYLAAAQFVLGDLPAPTIPSASLTPAIRAQEKLGWRLGIEAYTFHKFTLFEAIEKTAALGLPFMGGLSFQKVSEDIPKNFEPGLSDDELRQVRLKLDAAGVRLLTYYIQDIPGDEAGCRKVFEFGRKIGIETFMSEPKPEALDTVEKFCDAYDINVALHNHDAKASPVYWQPAGILKACEGRSKRLGACADLGYWMRAGIDPIQAVRQLKERLITVQMHDLHARGADGHDVPWGTGVGNTEAFLKELHQLGIRPTMFGLEYSYNWLESMPEIAKCVAFFNQVSLAARRSRRAVNPPNCTHTSSEPSRLTRRAFLRRSAAASLLARALDHPGIRARRQRRRHAQRAHQRRPDRPRLHGPRASAASSRATSKPNSSPCATWTASAASRARVRRTKSARPQRGSGHLSPLRGHQRLPRTAGPARH